MAIETGEGQLNQPPHFADRWAGSASRFFAQAGGEGERTICLSRRERAQLCSEYTNAHSMANFAILRTAKLRTLGSIGGSGSHTFRERVTPNADGAKTAENVHIGAKSTDELVSAVKARLPQGHRKNAVLAIEYMVTASPEAMQTMTPKAQAAYFTDALKWLKAKHGADNVVAASVHRDETTPHMVAYVVPLHEGKLNARHFLGGRQVLAEMQSEFSQVVGEKHGLKRGLEKSSARHKTIKQWYAEQEASRQAVPTVKTTQVPFTGSVLVPESDLAKLVNLAKIASDQSEAIRRAQQHEREVVELLKKKASELEAANASARHYKEQAMASNSKVDEIKTKANQMLDDMEADMQDLIRTTAQLLKSLPKADLAQLMGIELGKGDIFDALVKAGRAGSFAEAVTLTAQAYNEAHQTRISESARFVINYTKAENKDPSL